MARRPKYPIEFLVTAVMAGYSHREVAEALGVSKADVSKRLWQIGAGVAERPPLPAPGPEWFATIRDWAVRIAEYAEEQRILHAAGND